MAEPDPFAALSWAVAVSAAAGYCSHLEETDPIALRMQASAHRVEDVKIWARERIEEVLRNANDLVTIHGADLSSFALDVVIKYVARLDRAGYPCLNAQFVIGEKTK
jgi:hypothetical protein